MKCTYKNSKTYIQRVLYGWRTGIDLVEVPHGPHFSLLVLEMECPPPLILSATFLRANSTGDSELRRRCNAFFMELVSLFCFGESCDSLEAGALSLLMRYVTGQHSAQTKDFSPFPDYGIDATPVVRSFLLQQLLRSR